MQVFATSSVREPRRFEYWRELVAAQFVGLDCARTTPGCFYGNLAAHPLGQCCKLLLVKSTSQSIALATDQHRTQDSYVLNYLIAGHGRAVQNGNVRSVHAGDLFLFDLTSAAQLDLFDDFSILTVSLPRKQVDRYIAGTHHLCAIPVPTGRPGPGSVCKDMLQSLASSCHGLAEDEADTLLEALVRVLAATYGASPSPSPATHSVAQSLLLTRIRCYVFTHLGDDDLSPRHIARVHGTSERYLSKLFEGDETTPSKWIWSQRLEESRRMLASGTFAERTIKQIAHACGFCDMSHFSCAFKSRFGSTPREYRAAQAHLRHGDPDTAQAH